MTNKQYLGGLMVSTPFFILAGMYIDSLGLWKAMALFGVVLGAILFILLGLMLLTGEFDE